MRYVTTKDLKVANISCRDQDRQLPPTKDAIEKMKRSLEVNGQRVPVSVQRVGATTYRILTGATRFRAASDLGWRTIRAEVWADVSEADAELHELIENVDRHELKPEQRQKMKARIKELQRQLFGDVKPSKGGRGKTGGLRQRAREEGVPESTARDRQREAKLRENDESRAVSQDQKRDITKASPELARSTSPLKLKNGVAVAHMPDDELAALDAWSAARQLTRSEAVRKIVRERIAADAAHCAVVIPFPVESKQ